MISKPDLATGTPALSGQTAVPEAWGTLFEYNAVMRRTEEQDADGGKRKTVTLHVACGIRRPWPDGAVWTNAQKADFPGTPAGLEQAAAWLEERLAESDVGGERIGV